MAVDVLLEGVSYAASSQPGQWMVDLKTVSVDLDIAVQQPRATFDVWVWNQAIGRPLAGNEVVMLNTGAQREFGGILLQVEEEERAPTLMVYHCTCGDWTKWFDSHLVIATFNTQTVSSMVDSIVAQYVNVPGTTRTFSTAGVQSGAPDPVIPLLQFAYIPPSQALGQLTQMLGWGFFVDEYRVVQFYHSQNFQSPLPGNTLNADDLYADPADAADVPNWIDLAITEDISQVKNRVYITGIYIAQSKLYTETHVGDGATTTFVLGYQAPQNLDNITVTVNGSPVQVGLDLIDAVPGGPCDANTVYVNFTAQTLRFCTAPASGATIEVNYYPMTQQAVMEEDSSAIAFMAARDGTDGVREFNRLDPSLSAETPALAQQRAAMTLLKYAYPYKTLHFTSWIGGWRPGQAFTFLSKRRFGGDLDGLTFYVIRVQKRIVQAESASGWLWRYEIDAASTPFEI